MYIVIVTNKKQDHVANVSQREWREYYREGERVSASITYVFWHVHKNKIQLVNFYMSRQHKSKGNCNKTQRVATNKPKAKTFAEPTAGNKRQREKENTL